MRALILAVDPGGINPNLPWWGVLLTLLIVAVGGGGMATLLLLPRSRRKITAESSKIDADAAKVLTGAALALVDPLEQRVTALTVRVEDLEQYKAAQAAVLVTHASWDSMAIIKLQEAGIKIPPAPPLYPPT